MNGRRKHKSMVLIDTVGAGLALPGSEQDRLRGMAGVKKKGAASGAPASKQNAVALRDFDPKEFVDALFE